MECIDGGKITFNGEVAQFSDFGKGVNRLGTSVCIYIHVATE